MHHFGAIRPQNGVDTHCPSGMECAVVVGVIQRQKDL